MQIPFIDSNDPENVRRAFQKLNHQLGPGSIPTYAGLHLTGLTTNSLIYSASGGTLTSLGAATDGQLPIGSTGAAPVLATLTGTENEIDVTNGAGSITIGLVNPLIVSKGGTGTNTLTDHSILLGSGTDAVTPLGAATNGQLPIGSTGADPVLATLTGTTNQVNVANGAGSITLSTPQDIHVGASPTFVDLTLSDLSLGNPTYPTMLDFINTTVSVGWTSGGVVTDNEDGTVAVAAGTGYIKKTDSSIGELVAFDWSEDSSVALTNNTTNFVLIQYNGGSPIVSSTDDFNAINFHTEFVIAFVYREDDNVEILQAGNRLPDAQTRSCTHKFLRGIEWISGGIIAEKATRYLTATEGIFFLGDTKITTDAIDSSVSDFEHYYYQDGEGGWSETASTGQIDNIHYDDDSGTLAELTPNRYGVHWVYICVEGKLSVLFGRGDYSLNNALLTQPPGSIPDYLEKFATLAGRVIVKKSASVFTEIVSAYNSIFVPSAIFDHNDLSGLQGGAGGEYYHLTSAEYSLISDIGGLTPTDGNFIVGNDATWVTESGNTARSSLGLGTGDSPTFTDLTLSAPSSIYSLSHDSFADFVGNEHIDHTSVSISAGGILSGGGDISANRTISLAHADVDHDQTANVHQDVNTTASPSFAGAALSSSSGGVVFRITSTPADINLSNVIEANRYNTLYVDAYRTIGAYGSLTLRRSRGTITSATIVADTDELGLVCGQGYDGAQFRNSAGILFEVDGNPTANTSVPGAIKFFTTPAGSSTWGNPRLTIGSDGNIVASGSFTASNYAATNLLTACASNAGALDFSTVSKTLTVEDDAIVSQDYSNDASPTFAGLDLTGIADNRIPYVSAAGFTNSPLQTDGTSVGLGVAPARLFHLHHAILAYIHLTTDTSGATGNDGLTIGIDDNTHRAFLRYREAQPFSLMTSNVERLVISSGGLVSIGNGSSYALTPSSVLEVHDAAPYLTLHNKTHEDSDGGRESRLIARGEQSGGEASTLGWLEFSHDGTGDDQKGRVEIKVNDGNDGTSPSITGITIRADGGMEVPNLPTGATQVAAGAVAGELWATSGHASLPDNVVMIGV